MDSQALKAAKLQFMQITGTKDSTAAKYLKASNFKVAEAIDLYFRAHSKDKKVSAPTVSPKSIENIFETYKDPQEDAILIEGMERYCNDLEVDPTDISMLILAMHLGAEQMCEFKRAGFCEGWLEMGCDTIEKMKVKMATFKTELDTPATFKKIYQFAFKFGLSPNQRTLGLDVACGLWELLLPGKFPLLPKWLTYMQEENKKAVSRDTWNVLLDFMNTIDSDFSNYDPSGAWPLVYDEFVEYVKRTSS